VSRAPVGSTATAMIARGMPALPVTGNDLFGRVMVWLAQVPSGGVHFHTVNAYGKLPDGTSADYDIGGMYGTFLTNYHPHDCYRGSKTAVPTGRWFCLQWQFDGSPDGKGGTRNEARYWVDGAPLDALTVVRFSSGCVDGTKTEWLAPAFDRIEVGWSNSQATPIAIEQWVDDFAVDAKPVPCPAR